MEDVFRRSQDVAEQEEGDSQAERPDVGDVQA